MIDAHRGAFEYDWRTRFYKPLSVVGTKRMTWSEAVRLTRLLALDPSSQVCAALLSWDYPIDRVDLTLRDLYDVTLASVAKKPKPYPRPWKQSKGKTAAPGKHITQAQIIAALRKAGHTAPLPTRAEVTSG